MKEAFGTEGLDKLLDVRNKNMQEQYLQHLGDSSGVREIGEIGRNSYQ